MSLVHVLLPVSLCGFCFFILFVCGVSFGLGFGLGFLLLLGFFVLFCVVTCPCNARNLNFGVWSSDTRASLLVKMVSFFHTGSVNSCKLKTCRSVYVYIHIFNMGCY